MKKRLIFNLFLGMLLTAVLLGQGVTTSQFAGKVVTVNNLPIPGVEITAVHVPTGTTYSTFTGEDGRFFIPAVRVGGPYRLTAALESFRTEEITGVITRLGETKEMNFTLRMETMDLGEVTVVASDDIISTTRTGATQSVAEEAVEKMPSISRNFSDFTRLVPQVAVAEQFSELAYNVAGKNNRYNNVQIDGAVNNDLFGLTDSGTPGGQTNASPISLDAIQEFQVVIAPYDVRQGGFTGGGINAITRSGTNEFHGSVFWYGRNDSLVGNGPDDYEIQEFKENQFGFRLGGPIVKDTAFFFVNGEFTRRSTPNDYFIDFSGRQGDFNVTEADLQRFISICQGYGFDPGGYGEFTQDQTSNKFFGRFDWNINNQHRLTVRHNFVDADNDALYRSGSVFSLDNSAYTYVNRTNSTVAQLDSVFGEGLYNEFRFNYTRIRDKRDVAALFPLVEVRTSTGASLEAGTDKYSGANALDQDIIELTDDVTFYRGDHTIVIGTHNEFFRFSNLFIRDFTGSYRFGSLNEFEAGRPNRYEYSYSNVEGQPDWRAEFWVAQLGFYVGDTWNLRPNFSLTYGLRLDVPIVMDTPTANPAVQEEFGVRTDVMPSGNIQWSPRMGFNWSVTEAANTIVRGGLGIFSGRVPYVWISNQFSNTGIEFTRLYVSGTSRTPDFSPDWQNQPTSGFPASKNEIDVTDEDFTYPQVLRWDMGFDRELPWGFKATVESIYSKNINEILYQNLNLVRTGSLFDGRNVYSQQTSEYSDIIYLTNTSKGYQYNLSFQLQNYFPKGWVSGSYTYGISKDVNSGTSSQARSNFQYNHISFDPNNPALTYANNDVRHRIAIGGSYTFDYFKDFPTTISAFYNGRSGRPFNYRYYNDVNGDGSYYNDLIYVPLDENDIILTGGTWDDLNAYINSDPALRDARGSILERNAAREPWYHRMDIRLLQEFKLPGSDEHKIQFSWDIINFLNLLNSEWGTYEYGYYRGLSPLTYQGIDSATGKPKMSFYNSTLSLSQLGSRWQMQFGLRYLF
ncbi:MAG: TonB-dependent receptor [Acidobacteria bacterium]|nr:TonB-dependent receptor [Acidobacteriota bacterium]